ncbi:MAG: crossover junction endodeoxyribonuclease RuvC [Verrucomicrobia bacterium]|nr:crossover junction endodeoxyribonuclease RuvC [Verrucomicrobiota bacterium]
MGRILGIDPGSRVTGYGVIEDERGELRPVDCGVVRLDGDAPASQRYVTIRTALADLIGRHRPDVAAVESLFFCRNASSAIKLAQVRGVVLLAVAEAGLPVYEYAPRRVKQAVVGRGSAAKEQVGEMVKVLLGLREVPQPADATDALAVAICHAQAAGSPRGGGERT